MKGILATLDIIKDKLDEKGALRSNSSSTNVSKSSGNGGALKHFIEFKLLPLKRKHASSVCASAPAPIYCDLLNFNSDQYRLPTCFSAEDRSNRIDLAEEGRIVKYVGPGRTDSDAAAARANLPVPPQIGIYYYEVSVISKGRDGYISIGFAIKSASLGRLTGWEPGTVGYHADDGNLYRGAGTGTPFGPAYSSGDVVGCGINFVEKSFFFTKNGVLVGEITNLKDKFHLPFFPCVGCRTVGEVLAANFGVDAAKGTTTPFMFDISAYTSQKLRSSFGGDALPCETQERLILSYLMHSGFQKTSKAFLKSVPSLQQIDEKVLNDSFETAQHRRLIVEAVKAGNIGELGQLFKTHYPAFLMEHCQVAFQLDCLAFIELIRNVDSSNPASIAWEQVFETGRRLTVQFSPEVIEANSQLLKDCLSLVAYLQPEASPVSYLLHRSFRSELAAHIDEALLRYEGKSLLSPLHALLLQCQLILDELQYMEDSEISFVNI